MTLLIKTLVAIAASAVLVVWAFAQSTVVNSENEPAPSLTVSPPLPGPLAKGVFFIPYRLEHKVRIEAVDPEGRLLTAKTVTFTMPASPSASR